MNEEIESEDCNQCKGKGKFSVYKLTRAGSDTEDAIYIRTDEMVNCGGCKGTGKK